MTIEWPDRSQENMNPLRQLKKIVSDAVRKTFADTSFEIPLVEADSRFDADYALQVASLAKLMKQNPADLATKIASGLSGLGLFEQVKTVGPYVNLRIEMGQFGIAVVDSVLRQGKDYGKENLGKGHVVAIDMSSPNIAKRMSFGHLRSGDIGDAIANLYRVKGFEVIRDNHIGDWGTSFGQLIVAIKRWDNESKLLASKDPIGRLQKLYVRFHAEAGKEAQGIREGLKKQIDQEGLASVPGLKGTVDKLAQDVMRRKEISQGEVDMEKVKEDALDRFIDPPLVKEAREWFAKLEQGDPETRRIWKLCIDLSMREFQKMYDILGLSFELTLGESFYEGMLKEVMDEVEVSGVGKVSDGALVVDMNDKGLGVAIVRKSDGASVYHTRDMACAIYRENELKADRAIYVVGDDQKLYFQQLFEMLRRLGHGIGERSNHVYFGMVRLPEGKMSTRKGRTILLKDVVKEGLSRATKILKEERPEIYKERKLRTKIARQIAIGALKWNDLCQNPRHSIVFDWEKALNFDGYAAPYVQYAAIRARSILQSAGLTNIDSVANLEASRVKGTFSTQEERNIIKAIAQYPDVLADALASHDPSKVAIHVHDLAKKFSSFYSNISVLKTEDKGLLNSRLRLTASVYQVISNSLSILGIQVPERM